ncbi:MAG: HNH endonuclease signature motif containing protein, partial [Egibacteraceae bacterium]
MLTARDTHCRFAGCRAAPAWCDAHHIVWASRGGPTTLHNLVLCRRHHRAVHDHGWRLTLDPDDASLTIQRCQTTLHTHARAERTLRAPPPPR